MKPCILGSKVECKSELVFIDRRKLYFKIEVYHGDKLIAKCDHTRCLVPENFYKYN